MRVAFVEILHKNGGIKRENSWCVGSQAGLRRTDEYQATEPVESAWLGLLIRLGWRPEGFGWFGEIQRACGTQAMG